MFFRKDKEEKLTNDVIKTIRNGDLDRLKEIIEKNRGVLEKEIGWNKNAHSGNILHIAAYYNQHEIVKFLVTEKNMAVDGVVGEGNSTPIVWAAYTGSYQTVKTLLDLGANPDYESSKCHTAYYYCKDAATKELLRPYHESMLKRKAADEECRLKRDTSARLNGSWSWSSELPDTITHTHQEPGQQYLLTEIFNVAAESRVLITENLKTGQISQPETKRFDELSDKEVQEARAHLAGLHQANGVVPAEKSEPAEAQKPEPRKSIRLIATNRIRS
jgi:hypothetical protein